MWTKTFWLCGLITRYDLTWATFAFFSQEAVRVHLHGRVSLRLLPHPLLPLPAERHPVARVRAECHGLLQAGHGGLEHHSKSRWCCLDERAAIDEIGASRWKHFESITSWKKTQIVRRRVRDAESFLVVWSRPSWSGICSVVCDRSRIWLLLRPLYRSYCAKQMWSLR